MAHDPSDPRNSPGSRNSLDSRDSLLRHGSSLGLLTLASRVLGLAREMTKAALLGTSALSDAFSVAFMIPNLFRRLFAEGSIAVAFIPTFKSYLIDNDEQKTKEFLHCFFTFLSFLVSIACAIGIWVAPLVIPLFGFDDAAVFSETVLLTRVMFPFLAFISIAAFFQGILNSVHVFAPSGFAPVLLNIVTIASAWFLKDSTANPARALAIGIVAGGFLEAAVQAPFVWKKGFTFFFTGLKKAASNPGTRQVLRLVGPTVIGMAAYQINDLVSTALAGNAGEGVVSSLQYSLRLQELLLGVFAVSIGTVLLPDLSEHAKKGEWAVFNARLSQALEIIALIMIPVTFFALTQGETLIRLLFQTRRFDETSVALTLAAFNCHICGLYCIALNRVLAPAFYAQQDSASPTIAGIASFAVNIALAALLAVRWKGAGIAAALSLSSAVNTVLLFFLLHKKLATSGASEKSPRGAFQESPVASAHGGPPSGEQSRILSPEGGATALPFRAAPTSPPRQVAAYTGKITVFSLIAAVPVVLTKAPLTAFFARITGVRLLQNLIPFLAGALLFAAVGVLLLVATRDRNARAILRRGK
ncbi:MAG: murein biosynthesis integral membrane protein MurJ [Spirochaetaceae bacterium]|nr:murein biosynthesis integral membrane protein MurJ [Spirochaetaceae bacterium]